MGVHFLQLSTEAIEKLIAWRLGWMGTDEMDLIKVILRYRSWRQKRSSSVEDKPGDNRSVSPKSGKVDRYYERFGPTAQAGRPPAAQALMQAAMLGQATAAAEGRAAVPPALDGQEEEEEAEGSGTSLPVTPLQRLGHPQASSRATLESAQEYREPDQASGVEVPAGVFDITIRGLGGEVLVALRFAHGGLTRADILGHLMDVAPLPLGHAYKLICNQVLLVGERTLGECMEVTTPRGAADEAVEITAVALANEAQPELLQATEVVLRQNLRDVLEVASFARPPPLIDLTFKVLCELWCIQPAKVRLADGSHCDSYWQTAKVSLLHNQAAGLMECIREYNPDRNPRHAFDVLDQYVTGDSFVPSRVAASSRLCKVLCEWCCALHAYCHFNLENGLA